MALEITTNIDLDFYDKKYILINAKQLDKGSRTLFVTCYNNGEPFPISAGEHTAYIRYRKPDGHAVFNFCTINTKGKIEVKLTEQMLVVDGLCYADLVIVDWGKAEVTENGEIVAINDTSILSTMTFCIDVSETATLNSDIESTHEFNLLNKKLEEYWADYKNVVLMSKSWAVGHTDLPERQNENTDNSQYYCEQAKGFANNAIENADAASKSAAAAGEYEGKALEYRNNAEIFKNNAEEYSIVSKRYAVGGTGTEGEDEDNAKWYSSLAAKSASDAAESASNTAINEIVMNSAMEFAADKASAANASAKAAAESATAAATSAEIAQSYAVGGTEKRDGEDTDNAKWYYNEIKDMFTGLNIVFVPKGTVSFSELSTAKETAVAGYVYNINDDFVTDESFREGAGYSYSAGTNVYYTIDGFWDCFGGSTTPVASIDEVKDYLGIV